MRHAKESVNIIRLSEKDRCTINDMIRDKRLQFESTLVDGIMAFLSSMSERQQVSQAREKLDLFFSEKSKRKKDHIDAAASKLQDVTSNAPMGGGVAVGLVAAGLQTVGSRVIDNQDTARLEAEIREDLLSAQVSVYISPKDYHVIAKQVAATLGYRFQLILFRLAPGEDGYIKLAKFLIASLKKNAIEKLRSHHNDAVKALIDAALPNAADDTLFRQYWLGKQKLLATDPHASNIVARCGPAVRSLLGAYHSRYDHETGREYQFGDWTLHGVLTSTFIIDTEKQIRQGLEQKHRKGELLDGTQKYPPILLRRGEAPNDLGYSFATRLTDLFLNNFQVTALNRLVPDFFNPSEMSTVQAFSSLRYTDERLELPWSHSRDIKWKLRNEGIYKARSNAAEESEIVERTEQAALLAMENAAASFNLRESIEDLLNATNEAERIQREISNMALPEDERIRKRLEIANAAKDVAVSISNLMTCLIQCNQLQADYFDKAKHALHTAEQTLDIARRHPVEEYIHYRSVAQALAKIRSCADDSIQLKKWSQQVLQNVWTAIDMIKKLSKGKRLLVNDHIAYWLTLNQLKEHASHEANITQDLAKRAHIRASCSEDSSAFSTLDEVLDAFKKQTHTVRALLCSPETSTSPDAALCVLEACMLEIKTLHRYINELLTLEEFHRAPSAEDGRESLSATLTNEFANHDIHGSPNAESQELDPFFFRAAELRLSEMIQLMHALTKAPSGLNLFSSAHYDFTANIQEAFTLTNTCIVKIEQITLTHNITLPDGSLNVDIVYFYKRAMSTATFSRLKQFAAQKEPYLSLEQKSTLYAALNQLEALLALIKETRVLPKHLTLDKQTSSNKLQRETSTLIIVHDELPSAALNQAAAETRDDTSRPLPITLSSLDAGMIANFAKRKQKESALNTQTLRNTKERIEAFEIGYQTLLCRLDAEMIVVSDVEVIETQLDAARTLLDVAKQSNLVSDNVLKVLDAIKTACIYGNAQTESTPSHDTSSENSQELQHSLDEEEKSLSQDHTHLIEQLQHLCEQSLCGESPIEETHDPMVRLIYKILIDFTSLCTKSNHHVGLTETEIKLKLMSTFEQLKQKQTDELSGLNEHWGTWLIAEIASWMVSDPLIRKHGAQSRLKAANNAFNDIESPLKPEWPGVRRTLSNVAAHIQHAYTTFNHAKEKRVENARKLPCESNNWHLVTDTFEWAERLSSTERKWLDEKLISKRKKLLMTKTRSPAILIFYIMIIDVSAKYEAQKKITGHLHTLQTQLQECEIKLGRLSLQLLPHQKKELALDQYCNKYATLAKWLNSKLTEEDKMQDDWETLRNSIFREGLHIFFDEWKRKVFGKEAVLPRIPPSKSHGKLIEESSDSALSKPPRKKLNETSRFIDNPSVISSEHLQLEVTRLHREIEILESRVSDGFVSLIRTSSSYGSTLSGASPHKKSTKQTLVIDQSLLTETERERRKEPLVRELTPVPSSP